MGWGGRRGGGATSGGRMARGELEKVRGEGGPCRGAVTWGVVGLVMRKGRRVLGMRGFGGSQGVAGGRAWGSYSVGG